MITGVTELSVSVSVEDREGGSRTVVRLAGEADVTTPALAEVLDAEAAKKPRLLLVEVSGLTFIDSAALHQIDLLRIHLLAALRHRNQNLIRRLMEAHGVPVVAAFRCRAALHPLADLVLYNVVAEMRFACSRIE